jgi:opacity protein-like surface antigen
MPFQKICSSLFLLGLFTTPLAQAEGDPLVFVDVYGGYSWSQNQDADSELPVNGVPGSASLKDLDVHNGPAFGGRIGFWLKTHPSFGVAIDAAHFDTDIDSQVAQLTVSPDPNGTSRILGTSDIRVSNTLVTFDLIWRHRGERFTPYILAGPGLMFSNLDEGGFFGNNVQTKEDLKFGYKAGIGISYKISDNMHLITEYRYMHGSSEYNLGQSTDPVLGTNPVSEVLEIDIDTHLLVGGLSIRF